MRRWRVLRCNQVTKAADTEADRAVCRVRLMGIDLRVAAPAG
jgi:hypothetical protein